jgi:hypothetical protein
MMKVKETYEEVTSLLQNSKEMQETLPSYEILMYGSAVNGLCGS